MVYSREEKNDMLFCYYSCNRDVNAASELYLLTYMERRQPDKRLFAKLEANLKQYGSFSKPKDAKINFNEDTEVLVLAYNTFKPTASVREIGLECNVSREQARIILKQNNFNPYRHHIGNTLYPTDLDRRLNYATWFVEESRRHEHFSQSILFTDEAKFTNNGLFNRKNHIYWARENPHLTVERRDQHVFSINVWCAILGTKILGPYFYEENLNSERYLLFLQNQLEEMLDDLPLNLIQNLNYFQHDGAPAHNAQIVSNYLLEKFPNWIGNRGPIAWPPRSPDLTPLDFFLWGTIKDKVYKEKPHSVDHLKTNIRAAVAEIRHNTLLKVQSEILKRCQLCVQENGGHFEALL